MSARTSRRLPLARPFARDGFVVLERFIDRSDLEAVRRDVDPLLAAPVPSGCERPNNTLVPLRWNDAPVRRVLARQHRQRRLAVVLGARDLRWISGYVSVKEPHTGPLCWHQDWWCWSHPISFRREAAQVAVLCYLTDTTVGNGALRVIRGTHHASIDLHAAIADGAANAVDGAAFADHREQVTVAVTAGDAVAIDYRLLHATHANDSDARRDCLLLNFAPAWRELPEEIRAHLIRHPALPEDAERRQALHAMPLLPMFDGVPRDIELAREAPRTFVVDA